MKKTKSKSVFQKNKDEIKWNILNSLLAGALVYFGAFTGAGFKFNIESVVVATATALIVALSKFKDYWATQEGEYKRNSMTKMLFNFVG